MNSLRKVWSPHKASLVRVPSLITRVKRCQRTTDDNKNQTGKFLKRRRRKTFHMLLSKQVTSLTMGSLYPQHLMLIEHINMYRSDCTI